MSWPGHHTAFRWTPSLACGWAIAPDRLNFHILCYHYIEDGEEEGAELASRKPRSEDENCGNINVSQRGSVGRFTVTPVHNN
jgi:hypothetical protein